MSAPRAALGDVDVRRTRADVVARVLPAFFLAGLGLLFVVMVFPTLGPLELRYKDVARALPIVWLIALLHPAVRRVLPYRPQPSDLPLAAFTAVAALSVLAGGGHWGDVRNLLAAVGLALLCRSLFAPPSRRPLVVHYLGGLVALVVLREVGGRPEMLRLQELGRYGLVTANPNVLGFLFAMLAPIFLAETLATTRERRNVRGAVAALYYGLAVLGVYVTFSRTAAVGLAVGTFVTVLVAARRAIAMAAVVVASGLFVLVQRPDRWLSTRGPGDVDRLRIMRTSLSLALEHPILGVGFGINNLEEHFPARFEALYGRRVFRFHSANQLVDLLVGTGLVGTALAVWWAIALGREAARNFRNAVGSARLRAAGVVATLIAIAIMSLTEPPLYAGKLVLVLFVVLGSMQASMPSRDG